MVLNIYSFTITIKKRVPSHEKVINDENVEKIFEENRRKIEKYIGPRQF